MRKITVILVLILGIIVSGYAQIGKCKGKYLGNIIAYSVPSNYTSLWNQTTSENGSKWGSVENTKGVYNWGNSDLAYNTAKNSGGLFKFHASMWGAQTPSWIASTSSAEIKTRIEAWVKAVADHYGPMGGLKLIDVLNEPVNTAIAQNLKDALIAGYKAEPANAADINNQYGWAIWPFQLARKYFPDAVLLINEYNIEMNWNNCRTPYIAMANAIKNAPNLTDGKKNLIDGVGLQCHGINNLTAANFKACIDQIWDQTGLPVHITEFDITADPNETKQRDQFAALIPVAWEHPHVAGITFWGYIQGQTWVSGNGVLGPTGTDTGIQYSTNYTANPLGDRPAMTWLKQYFASQPSLACCPAPYPFANCNNGVPPTVSITAPTAAILFTAPATVTINATAADADGTISKVEFYNGTTKLGEDATSPYTYSWTNVAAGTYSITAVATDNTGAKTTSAAVSIKVNVAKGPYGGTAPNIPGKIEFENFDVGGNGVGYLDNTPGTSVPSPPAFRTDEDVDIETCTDAGGGYNIGYATAGEWLEYSVNVVTAGTYTLTLRVACQGDGRTLSVAANGVTIANNVAIPNTGGWQTWQDVVIPNITLTAGAQVIRVTIGATDYINLNYMTFAAATTPAPTVTTLVTYCQGATATALTATGTALKWYTVATGGTASTTAPTPSTATAGSTTYYVSQTVNNVESSRAAIVVTVNALPTATITASGATTFCNGAGSVTLSANTGTGLTYQWWRNQTTAVGTGTSTHDIYLTSGSYTVEITNAAGCKAISNAIVVTVNAVPAAPTVSSPVNYTVGQTATALTATGTALKWYTVATGGTASTTAPTPSTAAVGSTTYYVSQTVNTCESARAAITVTVGTQKVQLKAGWNLIGCPIQGSTDVNKALSSIWSNVEIVKDFNGFYSSTNAPALNSLQKVEWGRGYYVKVTQACELDWIVR